MVASIAWLDSSADEQRRVREMVALFAQRESRDELGIGQIRDVFSDTLFPGTSVLHTRPRYHLIVPWVYRHAARTGRSGADLRARAMITERRLIERLRDSGDTDGLIGRVAGKSVKILPSNIYWSGLRTYRILTADKSPDTLDAVASVRTSEADELAARRVGDWDPTLPAPPDGFPEDLAGGLQVQRPEADWLRDRIRGAVPGTLLTHLLVNDRAIEPTSDAPWNDPAAYDAPDHLRRTIEHAELFSLTVQGAALLYNLQIGERYEQSGYTRIEEPVEWYRDRYRDWLEDVRDAADALTHWDLDDFWVHCLRRNPRISTRTRLFVNAWLAAVIDGRVDDGPDNPDLRALVGDRERSIKRSQSRLVNAKLLGAWSGESGSGRLTYRWLQVRRMVIDLQRAWSDDART